MRVLVALHHLELGGSQLNALDLATTIQDRGHHVEVFATHGAIVGPVADLVRDRGLPLTLAESRLERTRRGAPCRGAVSRALTRAADKARADVIHAYEYSMILDAFYGPCLIRGTALVGTVYGMEVPTWLPRSAPVIAGTRELVDGAAATGLRSTLIVPPVDTAFDDPARVDGTAFRRAHAIADDEVLLVAVSRLEPDMKEDGIARAMMALHQLDDRGLRFVVVGAGPSFDKLAAQAASVNAALGREAIVMAGPLADPRPAYAAADVALGMGGSAIRAMAFGKPLIVLGIKGFSMPFEEKTANHFDRVGFYGIGTGQPAPLGAQIAALLDEARRKRLGAFSRAVVLGGYSLDVATDKLERIYREELERGRGGRVGAAVRTTLHRTAADLAGDALRAHLRPLVRGIMARGAAP